MIFVYAGPGSSIRCVRHTVLSIQSLTRSQVRTICPNRIIEGSWEKEADLFIIPGGADLPYVEALKGAGNQKIRAYVEEGGSFLGICAGSYYAGAYVEFAKGTSIEVLGQRELSFFSGTVEGPFLAPYEYETQSGARAAKIFWKDSEEFEKEKEFSLFYLGGGRFIEASNKENVTVLAAYEEGSSAIIECKVGKGNAILSGVHFEYNPNFLYGENPYLKHLIPELRKKDVLRIDLLKHLLKRSGLKCI